VDGDVQYMAMEYVDGPNLARTMMQLGTKRLIPVPLTLRIVADTCSALHYAHTLEQAGQPLRFVHRDVSLENILVSYAGQTKLGDFGIAKARTAVNVTVHGALKGKHGYIAPEVLDGKGFDHRADVYATGVTLYTLLTGLFPFRGDPLFRPRPAAPRDLNPSVSVELDRIVFRAIDPDPDRRFQSAEAMRDALEEEMRRTGVGLPRELAAFMVEVFPPGTDPLHDKFLRAMDLSAAPPQGTPARPLEVTRAAPRTETSTPDRDGERETAERAREAVPRVSATLEAETVPLRRPLAAGDTLRQETDAQTRPRDASASAEGSAELPEPQRTPTAYADTVSATPSVPRARTPSSLSTVDSTREPASLDSLITVDRDREPDGPDRPRARGSRRRLAPWLVFAGILLAVPVAIVVATWPLPGSPREEGTSVPAGISATTSSPLAATSLPVAATPSATRAPRIVVSVRATPPEATISLDGEPMTNPFRLGRTPLARDGVLVVSAPGYLTLRLPVSLARSGAYSVELRPASPSSAAQKKVKMVTRVARKPARKADGRTDPEQVPPKVPPKGPRKGDRLSDTEVLSNPYGGNSRSP
jgi:serine/threonine protein kinase